MINPVDSVIYPLVPGQRTLKHFLLNSTAFSNSPSHYLTGRTISPVISIEDPSWHPLYQVFSKFCDISVDTLSGQHLLMHS